MCFTAKKVGASRFGEAPGIDRIPYYGLSLAAGLDTHVGRYAFVTGIM